MKYILDTSTILTAWKVHYPPDIFPGVWKCCVDLMEQGDMIAPNMVLHELEHQDDEVYQWAKEHRNAFTEEDDKLILAMKAIMYEYPQLIRQHANQNTADPFVIALAEIHNGIVVTYEKSSNNLNKPKIPDVCADKGLMVCTLVEVLRNQGLRLV